MLKLLLLLLAHLMMLLLLLLHVMLLRLDQLLLLLMMRGWWWYIFVAIIVVIHCEWILRLLLKQFLFEKLLLLLLLLLAIVGPLLLLLLLLLILSVHRRIPRRHRRPMILRLHRKGHLLLLLLWRTGADDSVLRGCVRRRLLQHRAVHFFPLPHYEAAAAYHSRADSHANTAAASGIGSFPRFAGTFAAAAALGQSLLLVVLALHGAVPVVLDGVVSAPRDELGNLGPLVAPLLVSIVDDAVLKFSKKQLVELTTRNPTLAFFIK
jgi:hypothetical protein